MPEKGDEKMIQIRWILTITIICSAILLAGYRLLQAEPEMVTAAVSTTTANRDISTQSTSIDDIQILATDEQAQLFEHNVFGYALSYSADWDITISSENTVVFQSPDKNTRVDVTMAGVVPADGLVGFVDQELAQGNSSSRYSLTINGFAAEHVLFESVETESQLINVYIEFNNTIIVISGTGERALIENIARSFNGTSSKPMV
jgi:hypothetical protein